MGKLFARLLVWMVVVGGLMSDPRRARADPEGAAESSPRDVPVVVQPSEVRLPAAPAEFERIERGWLTLEFPASVRDRVQSLARDADEFRMRLSEELGQSPLDHALVRIARTPDQMAALSPQTAPPPAYAAGVAYPALALVLLSLQAPGTWEAPDLVELLRHEISHLALAEAVGARDVPRWFNEGLAIHESGELPWARRKVLFDASFAKRLLPFDDLDRGFAQDRSAVDVAYAESASVVGFLLRDADRARFGSLIQRVRADATFEHALQDAYGTDLRKLEYEWREEVSRHFSILPAITGGGLVWLLIAVLAAWAWVRRRRHAKAKLAQWAREEAEMEAALAAAARPRESPVAEVAEEEMPSAPAPGIPVVEHQGRWYTVH